MAKNITKTLQGKKLDFEELALRNEKVRAVGNMNVNAAGDEIDNSNKTVATNTRRASKNYRRQINKRVQDAPVMNSIKAARELAMQYIEKESDVIPGIDDITQVDPVVETARESNSNLTVEVNDVPAEKAKTVIRQTLDAQEAPVFKPVPKEEVSEELLQKVISKSTGGLAGAIAKAKEVKQEPLKTAREEARSEIGVKKI